MNAQQYEKLRDHVLAVAERISQLEADVAALQQWKADVITNIDRFYEKDWKALHGTIEKIESGVQELRPLLSMLEKVSEVKSDVKNLRKRLDAVEQIKERVRERFTEQTNWRTMIWGAFFAALFLTIGYVIVEIVKLL